MAAIYDTGLDINARDPFGMTPILAATISGSLTTVNFLLDREADAEKTSQYRGGELLSAPVEGEDELVRRQWDLVWKALPPGQHGELSGTPLAIAKKKGYKAIEEALVTHLEKRS